MSLNPLVYLSGLGGSIPLMLKVPILVLELRLREFFDYTTSIEFSWLNSGLWFASFEVVMHNVCWLVLVRLFLYLPVAVTSHVCSMFVYASYTVAYCYEM